MVLPGEVEPDPFCLAVFPVDDQIIALRTAREIAVNCFWHQQFFFQTLFLQGLQGRPDLLVEQLFILAGGQISLAHLPLPAKEYSLVEMLEDFRKRDVIDNFRTPEWRLGNWQSAGGVRASDGLSCSRLFRSRVR